MSSQNINWESGGAGGGGGGGKLVAVAVAGVGRWVFRMCEA